MIFYTFDEECPQGVDEAEGAANGVADGPAGTPKVIMCVNNKQILLMLFASGLIAQHHSLRVHQ